MEKHELTLERLEKIADSDLLAEDFADYMEEHFLISAPGNLKASIIEQCVNKTNSLVPEKKPYGKRLLFFYTLKVGAAAAVCIFALASAPSRTILTNPVSMLTSSNISVYQKAQQITDQLNRFTHVFSRWEVNLYDKKEK